MDNADALAAPQRAKTVAALESSLPMRNMSELSEEQSTDSRGGAVAEDDIDWGAGFHAWRERERGGHMHPIRELTLSRLFSPEGPSPPLPPPPDRGATLSCEMEGGRPFASSEDHLRVAYLAQANKGEDYYAHEQYTLAITCFNEAKCALLIVAGRTEQESEREDPGAVTYTRLRDQVDSALLSERITDCRVRQLSRTRARVADHAGDLSHVDYCRASALMMEAKVLLEEEISRRRSAREFDLNHVSPVFLQELCTQGTRARAGDPEESVHESRPAWQDPDGESDDDTGENASTGNNGGGVSATSFGEALDHGIPRFLRELKGAHETLTCGATTSVPRQVLPSDMMVCKEFGTTSNYGDVSATSFEEAMEALDALEDLLNTSTTSLARVFAKQGAVSAKRGDHYHALELFGDSITAWEEAADAEQQQQQHDRNVLPGVIMTIDHAPLILKTLCAIRSSDRARKILGLPVLGSHSLKNTTHLQALSTALQMARSYHAIGVESTTAAGEMAAIGEGYHDRYRLLKKDPNGPLSSRIVIHHHLLALQLICEMQHQQAFFNLLLLDRSPSSGGQRLTTHSRDLSASINHSDLTDVLDNVAWFTKRCTVLTTQQQVCISHASFGLGLRTLSSKWLRCIDDLGLSALKEEAGAALNIIAVTKFVTGLNNLDDLGLSDTKEEARVFLKIVSAIQGGVEVKRESPQSADMFLLYKDLLLIFFEGYKDPPRLFAHIALWALQKGLPMSAVDLFGHTKVIFDAPTPPDYASDLLYAIDGQIIIQVNEDDMGGAVQEMHRHLVVVSKWMGSTSLEVAKDLHRLGCFYYILGYHDKAAKHLEESLHVGAGYGDYDMCNSLKLLAANCDCLNDTETAIQKYKRVLSMEDNSINKARLWNTLFHLHIKIGGQFFLAVDCLEKSLQIQQGGDITDSIGANLIRDTMILYGNAMASKKSFSQAMYWYESALSANPNTSALHPSNLRACYNKGVVLFRNGDIVGGSRAFASILDEVNRSPKTAPTRTVSVLNTIGNIYLMNKDFAGAIKYFMEFLASQKERLSPRQKASTWCNIATAYYMMQEYEKSSRGFNEALEVVESVGDISAIIKSTVLCKLAYMLYKRKDYLRAYNLYTEAASIGNSVEDVDDKFSVNCDSYADQCRLHLIDQKCTLEDDVPAQKEGAIPKKPHFGERLISILDCSDETGYSDDVYPWNMKMLVALGVEPSDCDSIALPVENTKTLCGRALEYLLNRTADCQANYVLELEELLVNKLNSKFVTMKSLLDHTLETTVDM